MSTFRNMKISLLALMICLICLAPTSAQEARYLMGEVVVGLTPGTDIDTLNAEFGTTVLNYLPLHDLYLLTAPHTANLEELCSQIAAKSYVTFCHPNYLVDPMRGVQSSLPFADEMGSLNKYADQPAGQLLRIEAAQAISTGVGQIVGVIDGGINMNHPAFDGKVVSGWDYVDNDSIADEVPGGVNSGHGTFVAGVIHLVVPDATIRSYRVSDIEGEADGWVVAEAILQALADGCKIINVSLTTYKTHQAIATACRYASNQNVIVTCAAGNEYNEIGYYPGSDPNTVAVAALDTNLALAGFSCYGEYIAVVAPGTDIYSPFLDDGYAWWSGTSFAAPFAAAELAMLRALDTTLSRAELLHLLVGSAVDIDPLNEDHSGQLGAGVLNPYGAILNLEGRCGDIDGNLEVSIQDFADLIDAMYLGGSTQTSVDAAGIDGHEQLTNNDVASISGMLFETIYPGYCSPIFEASFPASEDTIVISSTRIPPNVSEWTVDLSFHLIDFLLGFSVTLAYDLPGFSIDIKSIETIASTQVGPFEIEDDNTQRFTLAGLDVVPNYSTAFQQDCARVTFTVEPATTPRTILFSPTSFTEDQATYTTVFSRIDDIRHHIQGWEPQIVSYAEKPGVDKHGYLCVGVERGNVDSDPNEDVNITDLSVLIDYVMDYSSRSIALGEADVAPAPNPDGLIDMSDIYALIDHMFLTYSPLPTCAD